MLDLFRQIEQPHLATGLENVSSQHAEAFLRKLQAYGYSTLQKQRELLYQKHPVTIDACAPLKEVSCAGSLSDQLLGEELIAQGKVGCLILSGGQGTRLGTRGPKGIFPVSPIRFKSLFQLFCERVVCASKKAGRPLPLAIMTSPLNDEETRTFFDRHARFGLEASQLTFFTQDMLPLLDMQGNWLLQEPGLLLEGPDGNGNALRKFFALGIYDKWRRAGVEYINVIFVDNPLADPFDREFCGFTARQELDVGVKVVKRCSIYEKMGIVVQKEGKLKIMEYSEFNPEDSASHIFSSPGLFCFHMEYIRSLYEERQIETSLHLARKRAHAIPVNGERSIPMDIFKCETFQFDLLNFTQNSAAILYPRERTYAPLKNAEGEKSPGAVREALLKFDKEIYTELSGLPAPTFAFELDPAFYYPSDILKRQMQGRMLHGSGYIGPFA